MVFIPLVTGQAMNKEHDWTPQDCYHTGAEVHKNKKTEVDLFPVLLGSSEGPAVDVLWLKISGASTTKGHVCQGSNNYKNHNDGYTNIPYHDALNLMLCTYHLNLEQKPFFPLEEPLRENKQQKTILLEYYKVLSYLNNASIEANEHDWTVKDSYYTGAEGNKRKRKQKEYTCFLCPFGLMWAFNKRTCYHSIKWN